MIKTSMAAILQLKGVFKQHFCNVSRYKVLRTQALDKHSAEILGRLTETDFDFWAEPAPGRSADIMASPENLAGLEQFLAKHQIQYSVMIDDVER